MIKLSIKKPKLGVAVYYWMMYNQCQKKLIHFNTQNIFCQERNSLMEESDTLLETLKELIAKALEQCTDTDILDLIYKLIINLQ